MIPKLIHHLWIDPKKHPSASGMIPSDVRTNLTSWQIKEPNYTQKIWSLEEITKLCEAQNMPEAIHAIRLCRFPAMQADIARLIILNLFGGFWVDLKLRSERRFLDRFSDHDLVLTEHFTKQDLPNPNGRLSNSFIGAAKDNSVIMTTKHLVLANIDRRMAGSIYHITGATNLEISLARTIDRGLYFMIPHQTAWDYLFTMHPGSYNADGMHWSQREQRESPYLEDLRDN